MLQEEKYIINNLYEFWDYVGHHSKTMLRTANYKALLISDSDWPRRIFDLGNGTDIDDSIFQELSAQIRTQSLPNFLTLTESTSLHHQQELAEAGFIPRLKQLGMIINLSGTKRLEEDPVCKFRMVKTAADADLFASIGAGSFNYRVDGRMIESILDDEQRAKLFIGFYADQPACCGIVFYDEQGYAGLHMIGTLPEFRGKGLASIMTIHLLNECIADDKAYCVLHASVAGERVYTKLGFQAVKEIITYGLPGYDGMPASPLI